MESNQGKAKQETKKGRRLLLFPALLQGHVNPMIQLANILHSRGFSVSIILTELHSLDQSKYPHFTFHSISDGLLEHEASNSDVSALLRKQNVNLAGPFREFLTSLSSDLKGEPVACLITDTLWYFTRELAESFKLPRIAFWTTSICSFLAFHSIPLFQKLGYLPQEDAQLEVRMPEFPPLKVKDIPVIKSRDPESSFKLISCMMENSKAASGLIFTSLKELEEPELTKTSQEFPMPAFSIGPLHKYFPATSSSLMEQDRSAISWLDKQAPNSVIYVSFGSLAKMDEAQLSEVAWGIADSMQPFLWVIRPGLVQNSSLENLRNSFLEAVNGRGYVVNWAPQEEVLAHPAIGGFWTHAGWNSTLESICEGVPMICSPFFGDQLVNSRFVNDVWKIGVYLEKGLSRGEIERTIRRLMADKEGEEMRERAASYKEKINSCVQEGGSSHRSLESLIDYISSF